jgi:uncharacterized damage-inducible protein DinB
MSNISLGKEFSNELQAEARACHMCLERIPMELSGWKPHEKSMNMGYLALLVAEIPKWITAAIIDSEIDLGTFKHLQPKTTAELVNHFDENLKAATEALSSISNEELDKSFALKHSGNVLFTSSKKDNVSSTINHLVHHRGQLTVYMRLNDIPVPSIHGPSADDRNFSATL